ncbi:spore coat associated protein CotJA [Geobacillus sp. BMUD]|uniref:spore coat associated protein CotJA n=1 Tax=Geobacillus TaxID=129337 RepID=UPI0004DF327E|nr:MULTISPECIES: spore coat associated protein CotJA [Geobacillus]NNU84014.1 spore coat associated protein CotJA [Geobacillus sp. BMUD]
MFTTRKQYEPYISPFDPCPPIRVKTYVTAPNLYVGFQPPNLPQFPLREALMKGTLWQVFYDPYYSPYETKAKGDGS